MAFIKRLLSEIRFAGQTIKGHGHHVQILASLSQSYSSRAKNRSHVYFHQKSFLSSPA